MSYQKANTPYTWVNEEDSKTTPINAEKLNEKEETLDTMDNRIVELEAMKANKAAVNSMVQDVQMNMATGVLTVTYVNGSIQTYDTAIEKIAVNFAYDAKTEKITITLENGNVQEIDLSAFITNYSFKDSETVAFNSDGSNVTAIVKEGSIDEKYLRPDYLAEIKVQSANAQTSANSASNSAKSASSDATTASDKAGEALASAIRAENAADRAEAVTDIHYATKDRAGIVAPQDIYVDEQGNMVMIAETTDSTLRNSYSGGISILAHGKYEQENTTGAQLVDIADFELVMPDTRTKGITFDAIEAGTYNLNIKLQGTATYVGVRFVGVDGTNYQAIKLQDGNNVLTCDGSANKFWFYIAQEQSDGMTASISDIMLSVEPLPYEKYTGRKPAPNTDYPQEIKKSVVSEVKTHGKNLLDCSGAVSTSNKGIDYTVDTEKGTISASGTSTAVSFIRWNQTYKAGTYILSSGLPSDTATSDFVGLYNSATSQYVAQTSGASEVEFTLTEDMELGNTCRIGSGETVNGLVFMPMVRFANITDATYEPYTESVTTLSNPIELGGIGEVADVLSADGIKRRFATVVFDGSDDEGWGTMNTNDNVTKRVTTRSLFAMPSVSNNSIPNILCTHYKAVTPANTHSRVKGITVSGKPSDGGNAYLYVYDENFNTSDISLWKAHLAANPMTVVYELAEPTTEELPTADQIALNSLKSFDGVTYVETDSEVKPTIHSKYGTSKVGAMALELQNENANLKLQKSSVSTTETKVSIPAKMGTDTASGIWNVELQRPTDADYTLLGWTIINPRADIVNLYVTTVDGYSLNGDIIESGAHAAFSVTIRAMWKAL